MTLLTYWLATESFAGLDLPVYASAVEALKKRWFASTGSSSKGEHLAQGEYEAMVGEFLGPLRVRLADGVPQAVANKLANAHRMGANEQLTAFFEEIQLPMGPVERDAIRARNAPAHGGLKAGADLRKLVRHGNAYRAIFERTFLKILGHDGTYIDRTALGHPARPLDEPCAGTA